jgi:hypothetical protein
VNNPATEKNRHWCLTLFLAIIFFSSLIKFFFWHWSGVFWGKTHPAPLLLSPLSFCHCVSAIAIFKWKKWGFWLFAITACLHMLICFLYFDRISPAFREILRPNFETDYWFSCVISWIFSSLGGLIGLVSLYVLLQIGGDKKAWTQLEEHQYVEK